MAKEKYTKQQLMDMTDRISNEENIDPTIAKSVIDLESSWNPDAKAKGSSATGLGQLISSTAKQYGVTDSTDPEQNIRATVKYLKDNIARYNGDVEKGVLAYHAGPGNVDKYGTNTKDMPKSVSRNYLSIFNNRMNKYGGSVSPSDNSNDNYKNSSSETYESSNNSQIAANVQDNKKPSDNGEEENNRLLQQANNFEMQDRLDKSKRQNDLLQQSLMQNADDSNRYNPFANRNQPSAQQAVQQQIQNPVQQQDVQPVLNTTPTVQGIPQSSSPGNVSSNVQSGVDQGSLIDNANAIRQQQDAQRQAMINEQTQNLNQNQQQDPNQAPTLNTGDQQRNSNAKMIANSGVDVGIDKTQLSTYSTPQIEDVIAKKIMALPNLREFMGTIDQRTFDNINNVVKNYALRHPDEVKDLQNSGNFVALNALQGVSGSLAQIGGNIASLVTGNKDYSDSISRANIGDQRSLDLLSNAGGKNVSSAIARAVGESAPYLAVPAGGSTFLGNAAVGAGIGAIGSRNNSVTEPYNQEKTTEDVVKRVGIDSALGAAGGVVGKAVGDAVGKGVSKASNYISNKITGKLNNEQQKVLENVQKESKMLQDAGIEPTAVYSDSFNPKKESAVYRQGLKKEGNELNEKYIADDEKFREHLMNNNDSYYQKFDRAKYVNSKYSPDEVDKIDKMAGDNGVNKRLYDNAVDSVLKPDAGDTDGLISGVMKSEYNFKKIRANELYNIAADDMPVSVKGTPQNFINNLKELEQKATDYKGTSDPNSSDALTMIKKLSPDKTLGGLYKDMDIGSMMYRLQKVKELARTEGDKKDPNRQIVSILNNTTTSLQRDVDSLIKDPSISKESLRKYYDSVNYYRDNVARIDNDKENILQKIYNPKTSSNYIESLFNSGRPEEFIKAVRELPPDAQNIVKTGILNNGLVLNKDGELLTGRYRSYLDKFNVKSSVGRDKHLLEELFTKDELKNTYDLARLADKISYWKKKGKEANQVIQTGAEAAKRPSAYTDIAKRTGTVMGAIVGLSSMPATTITVGSVALGATVYKKLAEKALLRAIKDKTMSKSLLRLTKSKNQQELDEGLKNLVGIYMSKNSASASSNQLGGAIDDSKNKKVEDLRTPASPVLGKGR